MTENNMKFTNQTKHSLRGFLSTNEITEKVNASKISIFRENIKSVS